MWAVGALLTLFSLTPSSRPITSESSCPTVPMKSKAPAAMPSLRSKSNVWVVLNPTNMSMLVEVGRSPSATASVSATQ